MICLVTLLSIVSGPRLKDAGHPEQDFVRSQAFYYALWAAILYFVDALLMSVTFWGSLSGHYSKNFNLTPSQRMLMVQSLIFVVHLLLGALVFSNIENWQYLDAVYWADATILTVGFGDFPVTSDLGRALLFPYALLGIVILGLIIASIRGIIVERERHMYRRIRERSRRRMARNVTRSNQAWRILMSPPASGPGTDDNMALDKLERRRLEFELIRKIERRAAFRQKWLAFVTSACVWFLLLFVGAAIFWKCEKPYQGWTYYDSYYFCYVSLTTIGYGDLTPVSNAGKSFFVFWSLLAIPCATILISNAGDTVVKLFRDVAIHIWNATILSGEHGLIQNAKHMAHRLVSKFAVPCLASGDQRPAEDIESHPRRNSGEMATAVLPATGGSAVRDPDARGKVSGHRCHLSPCVLPTRGCSCKTSAERRINGEQVHGSFSINCHKLDNLPSGHDLSLLLVSEIQSVSKHVHGSGSRRYSLEEWMWYMGLVGKGEHSNPDMNRTSELREERSSFTDAHRHYEVEKQHKGSMAHQMRQEPDADEDELLRGSWLCSGLSESEWILENLVQRLKESLSINKMDHERLLSLSLESPQECSLSIIQPSSSKVGQC